MPAIEHFITKKIKKAEVDEYFARELKRAGYGGVDILKTPLGTRVIIHAARPGIVIGRHGKNVQDLTNILEEKYEIENPQIEVSEIEVPELNAQVMAERLASRLERGTHYRRAAYSILRRIAAAGAKGVEIKIAGKISGHRARYKKIREGFVAKCGEPAFLYVEKATSHAILKKGIIGVTIRIMQPTPILPNELELKMSPADLDALD